jgi:hypothetical protein
MKRLYTYSDFVHNIIKESQDINSNMEVFALNEIKVPDITWTPEETNSMSLLDKKGVYDALEKKFFQRIDIILTGKVNLFDPTQLAGPNGYLAQEMGNTMYTLLNNEKQTIKTYTYQQISEKIKSYWKKFFDTLEFSEDLNSRYEAFKNDAKFIKYCKLKYKTPYEFIKSVYDSGISSEHDYDNSVTKEYMDEGIFNPKKTDNTWVQKTNVLLTSSNSEINSSEYKDWMKKIESWKDVNENIQKWSGLKKELENEFTRLYSHFHMWVFANMIMSGGPIASSQSQSTSSTTSPKRRSSASVVTSTTRERRTVDRASVGQTISDL